MFEHALDVLQLRVFIDADQGYGGSLAFGPAGAADAMHIVLGDTGQFEVHHMRQLIDIEPTCRNIRGHQDAELPLLEAGQRPCARILALIAVDGCGADPIALQLLAEAVGAVLGAGEDKDLPPVSRVDEMREELPLALAVHGMDHLLDALCGGVSAGCLDEDWCVQQIVGELLDVAGKGREEQQILAFVRQACEYLPDIPDKPHIQHAVRFVQDEDLDAGQVQSPLLNVVQQTSRCCHQDIDPVAKFFDLGMDVDAAEDDGRFQRQMPAVGRHALFHLGSELPGWG